MNDIRSLVLPVPPGLNHAYKPVVYKVNGKPKHGMALTEEAEAWKREAALKLPQLRPDWIPPWPWTRVPAKRLRLFLAYIWVMPEVTSVSDLDGYHKFTRDAIADAWGFNDSRIDADMFMRVGWPDAFPAELPRQTTLTIQLTPMSGAWPNIHQLVAEAVRRTEYLLKYEV